VKAVTKATLLAMLTCLPVWVCAAEAQSKLPRFEKFDGYAKDRQTNLLWQLKSEKSKNDRFTQTAAKKECENLKIGSISGWRLPEFEELKALADAKNSDPNGFLQVFADTQPKYYRTNTSAGDFTNASIVVGFKVGSVADVPDGESVFARCVAGER